jgi:hypothetical protein
MAQPPPGSNLTGAQKSAYAQQYGGTWNGSTYNPTGTAAPVAAAPIGAAPIPAATAAPAAAPINAPIGTGLGTTSGSSSSTYTSGSPVALQTATQPGAGGQTIQNQFRDALLGQLNTNPNTVSLSDPSLAPQVRAFQDAQTRSLAQQQQQLAEQAFAGGTRTTGAYGADLGALQQQQGEAIGQHNSDLIANEQQRRTQNLFNALGLGGNLLTQGSAQGIQNSLGQGDLALRGHLGRGQLGLGLLQTLLGDRQANDRLGFDAANAGQGFNQSAILKMLGL